MPFSRFNESKFARFPSNIGPFSRGSFKTVWRGRYTEGPRKGQECVSKAFTRDGFQDHYFSVEMRVIDQTQLVIDAWNAARLIDQPILLNVPEIWSRNAGASREIWSIGAGNGQEKRLVEPFIKNFKKFHSTDGWVYLPGDPWSDALQALSHFSYHNSGSQVLLCDIQGGRYQEGFALSDPATLSRTQSNGPTDLGLGGIHIFFDRHLCNRFCSTAWIKPRVIGPA